ncbi:helix-turn-helix domain-containing protein [Stenotrophomonas maltophilia]|nr:helix-turn-helix domain-containing protein [Stenotrophomonas maltophilia]
MGISQTALAAHLSWPQQRISSIESGSRRLDILEFCLIASALGITSAEAAELVRKTVKAVKIPPVR